jgi:hypothetical protein
MNSSTATSANTPASSADGLLIQLGTANASRTTGNFFVGFSGGTAGAGTVAGKIQGGASVVAYTTSGADYAEYFKANPNNLPQPGELVSLDPSTSQGVIKSNGTAPTGVVSTSPGFIGNGPICRIDDHNCDSDYQKYNVLVSMNGQVPTKVSVANGAINVGDPITASSTIPGVGVRATGVARIVGYAEQATAADGTIPVLIQPGAYNPVSAANVQGGGKPLVLNSGLEVKGDTALDGNVSVTGTVTAPSVNVVTANVSGDVTVAGTTATRNLSVTDSANTRTLAVTGLASFGGDIKHTAKVNTRQATLKTFTASKPITAGSVVILDATPGKEGQATTTTTADDTRVIGVAVTEAAKVGDPIDIAIGGWVQVRVDTTQQNSKSPAALLAGQLLTTGIGEGTAHSPGAPPAGSILGKTTDKQDVANLVWALITLQ